MGRLLKGIFGVSNDVADHMIKLEDAVGREEATPAMRSKLRELHREIPEHVQQQVRSERGGQ
jgi:hypothetical protein